MRAASSGSWMTSPGSSERTEEQRELDGDPDVQYAISMWPLYHEKLINAATDLSLEEYDIVTSFDRGMKEYFAENTKDEDSPQRDPEQIRKNAYSKGKRVREFGGLPKSLMQQGSVSLADFAPPSGEVQKKKKPKSHRVKRGKNGRRRR